jgi:cell division protein FtsW
MSMRERISRSAADATGRFGSTGSRLSGAAAKAQDRLDAVTGSRLRRSGSIANPREYALIVGAVTLLICFGAVMVFSASSQRFGMQMPIKTVVIVGILGVPLCIAASRLSLSVVQRIAPILIGVSGLLLVLVLIPGIGKSVNGARRWLGAGPAMFQPSELAKVAIVVFLSAQILAVRKEVRGTWDLIRLALWPVGLVLALIAAEDLGTAIVCVLTSLGICWLAGTKPKIQFQLIGILFLAAGAAVMYQPYRLARLTAFLNTSADPNGVGFQLRQGQIAIGSGGVFGVGPGQSVQKIFYLPEAHTDFILAVVGEELGLLAILFLLGCFGVIFYAGMNVARSAGSQFARLVAGGTTVLITSQAMLNICVVLGIAPLTGVPLPFISYGPTNLVVLLISVGLLLNVAADGGVELRSIDGEGQSRERIERSDRGGRHSGARSASAERRG